jgi:hypothetical protein
MSLHGAKIQKNNTIKFLPVYTVRYELPNALSAAVNNKNSGASLCVVLWGGGGDVVIVSDEGSRTSERVEGEIN